MEQRLLVRLKELTNGKQPKNDKEKQFLVGYSAALNKEPFSKLVLSIKNSLEGLSKWELLFLITGYSMGEIDLKNTEFGNEIINLQKH